jgi:predicted neuraminidase
MKVDITLKDPDGAYDSLEALDKEDKEFLYAKYITHGEYIDLVFDTETKELKVKPRF